MGKPTFTPEELEELKRFDAEIDETYVMTPEEFRSSTELDRHARRGQKRGRVPKQDTEYFRAYNKANREKRCAYQRAYYQANREEILVKAQKYRESNRERARAWAITNRDRKLAYQRTYDAAHREEKKSRQQHYYYEHREEILAKARERRARKKMNGGTENGTRAE